MRVTLYQTNDYWYRSFLCKYINLKPQPIYLYIPQLFNSFMRRLLGNGKWYGQPLRLRRHNEFSNKCSNCKNGSFKTMETVSDSENLGLSEKQGIGRVHGRLFANYSHNHATSTTSHFLESTKWLQTWLIPSGLSMNEIFSLYGFHRNTHSLCDISRCFSFFKIKTYLEFSWELLKMSNRRSCKTTSCTKIDMSANATVQSPRE